MLRLVTKIANYDAKGDQFHTFRDWHNGEVLRFIGTHAGMPCSVAVGADALIDTSKGPWRSSNNQPRG